MIRRLLIFFKSLVIWNVLIWIYSCLCYLALKLTIEPKFFTVVSFVYCAAFIFDLFKFLGLLYRYSKFTKIYFVDFLFDSGFIDDHLNFWLWNNQKFMNLIISTSVNFRIPYGIFEIIYHEMINDFELFLKSIFKYYLGFR